LLTLAPELPGALELIRVAANSGVIVSIGHTAATFDQIISAVREGARMSTHLFNGCSQLLDRHSNVIYSQLAQDALYASFIADGYHVPYSTLLIGIRVKGVAKSLLVSDLAHLSGLPDGEYLVEGNRVELREGGLRVKGTNLLSGAVRTLREDVERVARQPDLGIETALLMATRSPSFAVGDPSWADLSLGRQGPIGVFSWDGAQLLLDRRLGY
jgi:N-acetylglucosamine-6-phosphate deacetylase